MTMQWVREFVKNTFFFEPPVAKSPEKRSRSPSLNGRDTPSDLVDKASYRIAHIKDAQYTLHNKDEYLIVNLPKRSGRKNYVMPFYKNMDVLCEQIKEDMAYDGFESMTYFQLAAEYPFYFWNAMFHCLGRIDTLEHLLQEHGIQHATKRRRSSYKKTDSVA